MSGQWEIVSKAKKKLNGNKGKAEEKTVGSKAEAVLPLSQVQSQFEALSKNKKDNKNSGKENLAKDVASQKSQKKSQTKKKDNTKDKPLFPKTLDAAVKLINKKQLCSELKSGQAKFAAAPLVWLKGLVAYLNTQLTVENAHPAFEGKSLEYPQNLLSGDLREILKQSLLDGSETVSQTLFEWCLTAMATDISRGDRTCESVLGYKLASQIMVFSKPDLAVVAIPKVKSLLSSYHNCQPIGMSLLWMIGQGGVKNFGIGFRVWQDLMLPLADMRLYSSYILNYLRTLLTPRSGLKNVQNADIIHMLHLFQSPPENIPAHKLKDFLEISSVLMARVLNLPYETTLLPLFPTILQLLDESSPVRFQRELEAALLCGLIADKRVSTAWLEVYPRFLPQSRLLLSHLGKSWDKIPKTFHGQLKQILTGIQSANSTLGKKEALDEYALGCERLSKELWQRMASGRAAAAARAAAASAGGGGGGFSWATANVLLAALVAAVAAYDVSVHGSFRASNLGHFLEDVGALPYLEKGWEQTKIYSHHSYRWLQENGPEYYRQASNFSRPYLLTAKEALWTGAGYTFEGCKVAYAYVEEKLPLVSEWVEEWAPGWREKTVNFGIQVWEQGKAYSIAGGKALIVYGQEAITWAQTNVFIGSWSPDNLQQYSLAVLNVTQQYAIGTYDWVYQKVQTYSKVN